MRAILILSSLILIVTLGRAEASDCVGAACIPKEIKQDCTVLQSNGCIDWTNGIIYATGMGVPNPNFKTAAQRRYSAYEAAKSVALRNLLMMVEEVNIDSTKTVKAGMLESDVINTRIKGRLKQVEEVGKPKVAGDGSVWVTMRLYLRDVFAILVKNEQFQSVSNSGFTSMEQTQTKTKPVETPKSKTTDSIYGGNTTTVYTGLIIDAKGTGVVPAMAPKVLAEDGREVYGSQQIKREFAIKQGVAGYVKGLDKAKQNSRVKGNPIIIKAKRSQGKKGCDLVISNQDAKLLDQLNQRQSFLREARVLILI